MASYNHFSNDNVALVGSRDIGVFRDGEKVGRIPLGSLRQPNRMRRLYSFGIISDTHINQSGKPNANWNMGKAADFFESETDVEFVCNCGDLVGDGTDETAWKAYKVDVDRIGKPVYSIGGNHEQWIFDVVPSFMKDYVGNQSVWFSKVVLDDVFFFLGTYEYINTSGGVQRFLRDDVLAIQKLLDDNRNKRCFVFHHVPITSEFEYNIFGEYTKGSLPMSLFKHYKNITVFSGHTHSPFSKHMTNKSANVNRNNGFRAVHVPALCDHCEGYVVDVYEDGIHLRGMNFKTGYIPIASYWVDTSLVDVSESYTYKGE